MTPRSKNCVSGSPTWMVPIRLRHTLMCSTHSQALVVRSLLGQLRVAFLFLLREEEVEIASLTAAHVRSSYSGRRGSFNSCS